MTHPLQPLIARLCDPRPLSAGPFGTWVRRLLAPCAGLALAWVFVLLRLGLWAQAWKNA